MRTIRTLATLALSACIVFGLAAIAEAQAQSLNPLKAEVSTIPGLLSVVYKAAVMVLLPIISIFIVVSGFMFVAARGNQEKLRRAKVNFFWTMIATVGILGVGVFVQILWELGKSLFGW